MLYLNKQSQMASFLPSASEKKRLSRENKQQLTSHPRHEDRQEEQTPALRSGLSRLSSQPRGLQTSSAAHSFTEPTIRGWLKAKGFFFLVQYLVF